MKTRRWLGYGIMIFFVLIAGFLFWLEGLGPTYFSNPAALREGGNYHISRYTQPTAPIKLAAPFGPVEELRKDDQIQIKFDARSDPSGWKIQPNYEWLEADDDFIARLPTGGEIRLTGIASYVMDPNGDPDFSGWFDPRTKRPHQHDLHVVKPSASRLKISPLVHWMVDAIDCEVIWKDHMRFDARTGVGISGPGSSGFDDERKMIFASTLGHWHDGPQLLMVDVSAGPQKEIELPFEPGAQVEIDGQFRLQLVTLAPGDERVEQLAKGDEVIHLEENSDYCIAFTMIEPKRTNAVIRLRAYRKDGTWDDAGTPGWRGSSAARSTFNLKAEDVERLTVRYFPNWYRVVFEVPEIPGDLLVDYTQLTNLFNTPIPRIEIEDGVDLVVAIRDMTHLSWPTSPDPKFPPGYFPKAIVRTTPAELLHEAQTYLPEGAIYTIDQPGEIVIVEPKPWTQRLKEKLKRWWPF